MHVTQLSGIAGVTLKITADDTSNSLITDGSLPPTADVGGQTGALLTSCLITVETYDLRFGHGITVTSSLGHLLYVSQSLVIENPASIRSFRYINAGAGENSVIMVTPYYGMKSYR